MSTDEREIGWLHVKPEYYSCSNNLICARYILPPDPVDENTATDDRDNDKKRKRGQNKNRKQANVREPIILCHSYAQNIPCPFGEKFLPLRTLFNYIAAGGPTLLLSTWLRNRMTLAMSVQFSRLLGNAEMVGVAAGSVDMSERLRMARKVA